MPTYVLLMRYTPKGTENIKDSPARIEDARKTFKALGGELIRWYLTLGRFDGIALVEAPDDDVMARATIALNALGNVRTETLRAYNEAEFRSMIDDLEEHFRKMVR